jgi:hypothetical protein
MSTSGLKFGDAQFGATFFIPPAPLCMASAAKDDDAHAPAAKLIRAKSERRVKSIACRMTTPGFGATKHIRQLSIMM